MKNETMNEVDRNDAAAIEETELQALAFALRVQTGLQAGSKPFVPCI